jgi:hypothetical protein
MKNYVILNSRKRAIIALIHTVAFLFIAVLTGMKEVHGLHKGSPVGIWAVAGIYVVVSSVLMWITAISGPVQEKLYFACCTTSAIFGLGRQVLGDASLHFAVYVRVFMLLCAVATGALILREYSFPDSTELSPADSN